MELTVIRQWLTVKSTCGGLLIDGSKFCFTLELPIKDGLPGSAIPEGRYQVIVTYSPKFMRDMPLIVGIPERSEIRFHWLNTPSETDGCIGVGFTHLLDFIGESRAAFEGFWEKCEADMRAGTCFVTVTGGEPQNNHDAVQDAANGAN